MFQGVLTLTTVHIFGIILVKMFGIISKNKITAVMHWFF